MERSVLPTGPPSSRERRPAWWSTEGGPCWDFSNWSADWLIFNEAFLWESERDLRSVLWTEKPVEGRSIQLAASRVGPLTGAVTGRSESDSIDSSTLVKVKTNWLYSELTFEARETFVNVLRDMLVRRLRPNCPWCTASALQKLMKRLEVQLPLLDYRNRPSRSHHRLVSQYLAVKTPTGKEKKSWTRMNFHKAVLLEWHWTAHFPSSSPWMGPTVDECRSVRFAWMYWTRSPRIYQQWSPQCHRFPRATTNHSRWICQALFPRG